METKLTIKHLITKSIASATQEMILTLPQRLLMAFHKKVYEQDIDPKTGKRFECFYDWLMAMPPPGCGLSGSADIDVDDIIRLLTKSRGRQPTEEQKTYVNDLIEELVKGNGRKKAPGRPKKEIISPVPGILSRGHSYGRASTLAARMAESTDPKIKKAWKAFLNGEYKTITRAAIESGLIKDPHPPLARLKQNWRKASLGERREFLKFIAEEIPPKLKLVK